MLPHSATRPLVRLGREKEDRLRFFHESCDMYPPLYPAEGLPEREYVSPLDRVSKTGGNADECQALALRWNIFPCWCSNLAGRSVPSASLAVDSTSFALSCFPACVGIAPF
jgi:hypothetical protein